MPEKIGTIVDIKVGSFLSGGTNEFDVGNFTLKEASTNATWLFYIWNAKSGAPAVQRVLHSQRLALAREAAFRKATVHVWHEEGSSNIDQMKVVIP